MACQVETIEAYFGGRQRFADALGVSRVTVWRWAQPRITNPKGNDGYIPSRYYDRVAAAALDEGVVLRASDFFTHWPFE